jgi:hypothetical protein
MVQMQQMVVLEQVPLSPPPPLPSHLPFFLICNFCTGGSVWIEALAATGEGYITAMGGFGTGGGGGGRMAMNLCPSYHGATPLLNANGGDTGGTDGTITFTGIFFLHLISVPSPHLCCLAYAATPCPGYVSGTHSYATGRGLRGALYSGEVVNFTITARDYYNGPVPHGRDTIMVNITGPGVPWHNVTDYSNGTYLVMYNVSDSGNYTMHVAINDQEIINSSFALFVLIGMQLFFFFLFFFSAVSHY